MSRFSEIDITVEDLIGDADGGDNSAKQLLEQIKQYAARKRFAATTKRVKKKVEECVEVLASREIINGRDRKPWDQLRGYCDEVIELIDPSEAESTAAKSDGMHIIL